MKIRSILGLAAILAALVWLAAWGENWRSTYAFTGRQDDYYNLLVHGFLQGHLYMDTAVDPRMLSPDVAVRRQANVAGDASFYQGKYYIYFGVVPAALIFLPYRLVTGQDLSENAVCAGLVILGFLLYLKIYGEARRRYFPALSLPLRAASVLLLAFGAGTPALLILAGRYEIAIAGGYASMAAAWLGIYRAQHSPRPASGLILASVGVGLAIGCRPTYVLMLPILAGVTLWLGRTAGPGSPHRRWASLAAAAVLPAGFIGLLLAAYNYARFGNPLEFGFHYQINNTALMGGGQNVSAMKAAFLWTDLQWYYLRWPTFSPYFPYVFPVNFKNPPPGYVGGEASHGHWPAFVLTVYVGLMCSGSWLRKRGLPAGLAGFLIPVAAGFASMLAALACFSTITNRYLVDFQASLVLLLALAGGYVISTSAGNRGGTALGRAGFGLLAILTALFSLLVSFQLADRFRETRPRTYAFLAHAGDYPAALLAKMGVLRYGPVRFTVTLAPVSRPTMWPLVATGVPYYNDVLYLIQEPNQEAQFLIVHEGREIRSRLISAQVGRTYTVEADLGSLYPPSLDPYFNHWRPEDVERLKTRAFVKFGDEIIFQQKADFYDSPPAWVFAGQNPAGIDLPFNGQIGSFTRLPPPTPGTPNREPEVGVWRLRFTLPAALDQIGHPILGSGSSGHGNLLFLQGTPEHRIQFSLDQWNFALAHSPALAIEPSRPHLLEIFVGPQVARQTLPADGRLTPAALQSARGLLRVWLDGRLVWTTAVAANLDSYDEVALGNNPQGF